jgi:hypothetical protein
MPTQHENLLARSSLRLLIPTLTVTSQSQSYQTFFFVKWNFFVLKLGRFIAIAIFIKSQSEKASKISKQRKKSLEGLTPVLCPKNF